MRKNGLTTTAVFFAIIGCFSCSRPVEIMPSTAAPIKIALIYQPASDFYSALAIPENQIDNDPTQPTTKWGEGHIALFSTSSKAIIYLLNNRPTHRKETVKAVLQKHQVLNILVHENDTRTQKTFVINYTE